MKRPGIVFAAGLVLVADAFALLKVAQNRAGEPLCAAELTERELRLVRPQKESTALFLQLRWQPSGRTHRFEDGPGWFDQRKLAELGYKFRVAVDDPLAPAYSRAMRAKPAFGVFEYRLESAGEAIEDDLASRLWALDVGLDPVRLRERYPDVRRFLIIPCLVRVAWESKLNPERGREPRGGYPRGVIVQALVSEIAVPPSERPVFAGLSPSDESLGRGGAASLQPRYAAVVNYGKNYEPWVTRCRRISPEK